MPLLDSDSLEAAQGVGERADDMQLQPNLFYVV